MCAVCGVCGAGKEWVRLPLVVYGSHVSTALLLILTTFGKAHFTAPVDSTLSCDGLIYHGCACVCAWCSVFSGPEPGAEGLPHRHVSADQDSITTEDQGVREREWRGD